MNAKTFRDQLLLYLYDTDSKENVKEYVLTDKDWEKIDAFAAEYTDNWDWNYGKSPEFDMERSDRLSVGTVEVKMNVRKGNIDVIRIYGDFFGLGEIEDVEDELTNIPYTKEAITNALNKIDINKYFGSVDLSELVDLIY